MLPTGLLIEWEDMSLQISNAQTRALPPPCLCWQAMQPWLPPLPCHSSGPDSPSPLQGVIVAALEPSALKCKRAAACGADPKRSSCCLLSLRLSQCISDEIEVCIQCIGARCTPYPAHGALKPFATIPNGTNRDPTRPFHTLQP
jgi:hypothetical protein